MDEYWVRTQKALLGDIEKNEEAINDYKQAIAGLHKDNDNLRRLLEDLKKLQ